MKYRKQVHYVKGVFVCPKCHQTFVQEKWLEEFRVRCPKIFQRQSSPHVEWPNPTEKPVQCPGDQLQAREVTPN